MKKTDAERAIRHMCCVWAKEKGLNMTADEEPSFFEFFAWVENNYSSYLAFRDTAGVRPRVEQWFDEEFRQTWRN